MEKDSKRMEVLFEPSVKALKHALESGEHTDEEYLQARLANGVLGTIAKFKQTERAQEANSISLAKLLAQDKAQFAELIKTSFPDHQVAKRLPEGKRK